MFAVPPPLRPGDLIRVIAPSGPFEREDFWPGLAWIRTRYRLLVSPGVLEREGYLAGTDARRHEELCAAMTDRAAKAIVVARGGYGAMRVLEGLPWDALCESPKWIVGFSDVTALHAAAWSRRLASVHGPNVLGLGPSAPPAVRASLIAALERPAVTKVWRGLRVVMPGRAEGVLVGGNLSLLCAMAAAGRLAIPPGAVLAIEDVNEAPYRVDRMLTSLQLGKHLEPVSALVLGGLDRSQAGPDGWTVEDVVERFARTLTIPVVVGAPFGHRPHNEAFVLGSRAVVADGEVAISFGEAAAGCSA
jgi:muramoyltetrapeptide carboxypeptidase